MRLTENQQIDYYNEGWIDFNNNISKCPYEQGSDEAELWKMGHLDAWKADEHKDNDIYYLD